MRFFGLGFFMESSPPWALVATLKQFYVLHISHGAIKKIVISPQWITARKPFPRGDSLRWNHSPAVIHCGESVPPPTVGYTPCLSFDLKGQCYGIFESCFYWKKLHTVPLSVLWIRIRNYLQDPDSELFAGSGSGIIVPGPDPASMTKMTWNLLSSLWYCKFYRIFMS